MGLRYLAFALMLAIGGQAVAQEDDGPIILSERLQEIALEYPIAERLGINWKDTGPDATTRYIGFLSATNVLAKEIADRAGRESPTDDDYRTALFLQCIWPPNKPALVEEYWSLEQPAFYSAAIREALRKGVGPGADKFAAVLAETQSPDATFANVASHAVDKDTYFAEFFDVRILSGLFQ